LFPSKPSKWLSVPHLLVLFLLLLANQHLLLLMLMVMLLETLASALVRPTL
jgi:hypothetical protein